MAALLFITFLPLPPEQLPANHTGGALAVLVLVAFFCGGFIGRRAFSADSWSDLRPSFIASYVVIGFLCLISNLDFAEAASMIGFASAGIVASALALLLLGRRFPAKAETHER